MTEWQIELRGIRHRADAPASKEHPIFYITVTADNEDAALGQLPRRCKKYIRQGRLYVAALRTIHPPR